jgi:chemotaxis protein CheD
LTENARMVAIGEIVVSENPGDVLVAYGLGSCVAVCLYDPVQGVGGMLHSLLPATPQSRTAQGQKNQAPGSPAKFVDQGVPLLVEMLLHKGAKRAQLFAQLCGGAQVLSAPGYKDSLKIGERNILAAATALQMEGVPIRGQATGGHAGRTAKLYIADGQVTVRVVGENEQALQISNIKYQISNGKQGMAI